MKGEKIEVYANFLRPALLFVHFDIPLIYYNSL